MDHANTARERLLTYRRSLPGAPRLTRRTVSARGLAFAVYSSPPVLGARPLVCINGGLLYPHTILWPALSPLARGRQLFLYDQRGRGETEAPAEPLAARIEHDAEDVVALRGALGLGAWDVLGHSWGGGIAALAAERDRQGIGRLVLVDAVGPTSEWLEGLHERAVERLDATDRARLQRLSPSSLRYPDPAVHSAYSQAIYPAWFRDRDLARSFLPPRSASLTGASIASRMRREGYDWRRLLGAIGAPAVVLHGEDDLLLCATAHELSALVPQARLELIPESGHMPFWEAPETFFNTVDSFLTSP